MGVDTMKKQQVFRFDPRYITDDYVPEFLSEIKRRTDSGLGLDLVIELQENAPAIYHSPKLFLQNYKQTKNDTQSHIR